MKLFACKTLLIYISEKDLFLNWMLDSFVSAYFFPNTLRAHFTTLPVVLCEKEQWAFWNHHTLKLSNSIQSYVHEHVILRHTFDVFGFFLVVSESFFLHTTVCRLGPALSGCNLACNCRLSTVSYKRRIDHYDPIENLRTRS